MLHKVNERDNKAQDNSDTENKTHKKICTSRKTENKQKMHICYKMYEDAVCVETQMWILLFINVQKVLSVSQQGKGSDITALHVMQEVGEWRGVSTNQSAQTSKTLTKREEEMSARLT